MWYHLVRVGIDNVAGYVTTLEGLPTFTPKLIQPADLAGFEAAMVLDVHNRTEHTAGHIPGSHHLSGGRVMWYLDELPTEGTIVTYCQFGVRNSVAVSALRCAGYHVVELDGSDTAWTLCPPTRHGHLELPALTVREPLPHYVKAQTSADARSLQEPDRAEGPRRPHPNELPRQVTNTV